MSSNDSIHVGTVLGSLIASFIVGGVILYGMTKVNSNDIDTLKINQMSKDLIEVKLDNIIDNITTLKVNVGEIEGKLDQHIRDTTEQ